MMQLMKRPRERKGLFTRKDYGKKELEQKQRFVDLSWVFNIFLCNSGHSICDHVIYMLFLNICTMFAAFLSWLMSSLPLPSCLKFRALELHFL